jgi:primosomal replication protein N
VQTNRVSLGGEIIEIGVLRHTPAGLPVLNFRVAHVSEQVEAGAKRQVQCAVPVMAIGEPAQAGLKLKIGDQVALQGFLSRRGLNSPQLVLHVNKIELIEEKG